MKILILICSILFSKAHSIENKIKVDISGRTIVTDTSKYAILKLNSIPEDIFDKHDKPAELTVNDINQIEELIIKAVKKHNKTTNKYFQIKNPLGYYKQFIAVTNSKGEKEVWVNCLCHVANLDDWRKSIISVLDGGTCYFQLKINLTTNRVYDFGVNGVA